STLDTHLNWGASYWSNDLYKGIWVERLQRREAGPRELVLVARLSTLVIVGIALAIMTNIGSIRTAWQISLLFGAGTGAVLVLRWLWERVNLWSEIGAIVTSLVIAPLLIYATDEEWIRLGVMSGTSLVVVVATAFLAPATRPEKLVAFYRRVRPPGWWQRTATAAGEDPGAGADALRDDLVALAACAFSVYAWLTGIGLLLLQSAPVWVGIGLVSAGTLVTPVWLRALRRA
ncbi:MAG: sodium transporter, partial [Gammaproteobacteria bacterium]